MYKKGYPSECIIYPQVYLLVVVDDGLGISVVMLDVVVVVGVEIETEVVVVEVLAWVFVGVVLAIVTVMLEGSDDVTFVSVSVDSAFSLTAKLSPITRELLPTLGAIVEVGVVMVAVVATVEFFCFSARFSSSL